MVRFTPWPKRGGQYGAPMGRQSAALDLEGVTADALAVAGPAGEYDAGGAYWGFSPSEGGVYAVWVKGKGRDGVAYVRARSRASAKAHALGPYVAKVCKAPQTHNGAYSLVEYRATDSGGNVIWQHVIGVAVAREYAETYGAEFVES